MRGPSRPLSAAGDTRTVRLMRCVVGEEIYCLNMHWVRGVQRAEAVSVQPQGDGAVGWLLHETHKVPVLSLAARLQRPGATTVVEGSKVVLCNSPFRPLALLVERLDGIIEVPSTAVFPLPRLARNPAAPWVESVVKYAGAMLLALAPAGLAPAGGPGQTRFATADTPDVLPGLTRVPPAPGKQGKIFCFTTGEQPGETWPLAFGISVSQVAHMQQSPALCLVPGAVPSVLGLTEWQGCPLAVIDLSRRLGGAASVLSYDSRLLIARATTTPAFVSFLVRPQVRVWNVPPASQRSTRPLTLQASLLRGRFDLAHETLVIPDIDRLLVLQEEQGC